jgi:hypothetical protein
LLTVGTCYETSEYVAHNRHDAVYEMFLTGLMKLCEQLAAARTREEHVRAAAEGDSTLTFSSFLSVIVRLAAALAARRR